MQINIINNTNQNIVFGNKLLNINLKSNLVSNNTKKDIFTSSRIKYPSILQQLPKIKIKLPFEIASIITGKIGKIRTSEQLSTDDIIKIINFQLKPFQKSEIEKLLKKYPAKEQDFVKKLLIRLTQFGKLESLSKIAENIDGTLFQDTLPACGTTLRYLQKQGHYKGLFNDSAETGSIIIDKLILERLDQDSEFLKKVLSNPDFKFILAEGYITGVNPFSQTQDFAKLLKEKTKAFKTIQMLYPEKTEDEIFSIILNQPIIERLNKMGIPSDRIKIIQNLPETKQYKIEDILNQLNSKIITKSEIENIFSEYNKKDWPYLLEILAQTLKVKSTRTCSDSLKRIYQDIIKANGGNDDGIYYLLPSNAIKSFSTIIMQFCETNNINASRIIQYDDLGNEAIKKARAIVILDDMACSGESLKIVYSSLVEKLIENQNEVSDIIVSPIICTKKALPLFDNISYLGRNISCIPGEIVEEFSTNNHLKSLKPEDIKIYERIMTGGGYEGGDYSIAFPYMAPDNNNKIFATIFAEHFTLGGLGVKGKSSKN